MSDEAGGRTTLIVALAACMSGLGLVVGVPVVFIAAIATPASASCSTAVGNGATWVKPVEGPITARFGQTGERWSSGRHTGLDYGVPTGTPIKAAASGTVVLAGPSGPYGNLTRIDVGNDTEVWYAHQSAINVSAGQAVTPGQVVGLTGATGNVSGPHLHVEVRVGGTPVDPEPYFEAAAGGDPAPGAEPAPDPQTSAAAAVLAARAARAAGFPRQELVTAVAVAGAESRWNPTATNLNSNGTMDYGLFQINSVHQNLLAGKDWKNPRANAAMAFTLWSDQGWDPWVGHSSGAYLKYLSIARLAVAQLGEGDTPGDSIDDPAADTESVDFGCASPDSASSGGRATDNINCTAGTDNGIGAGPDGVPIRLCTVNGIVVDTTLAPKLAQLLDAARSAGLSLAGGAYRSHAQQIATRRNNCGSSDYDIWQKPASQCSPPTAIPGTSMHEWGLAVDFTSSGALITSHSNAAFGWLQAHAATYGLKNLPSEPWHWSTNGR